MKNKYQQFLILIGIDIFILTILILYLHADQSVAIIVIFILPIILLVNIVLALVLWLFRNKIYKMFLLNAVVACVIFGLLFSAWFYYRRKTSYKIMTFNIDKTNYELELGYRDSSYDISEIPNDSLSKGFERGNIGIMRGRFEIKNGRIYLMDSIKIMTVYQDSLAGFGGDYPKLGLTTQ
jgi:hypothetical protein